MRILKYKFDQCITFPGPFKVLSVGLDPQEVLCLWAEVEDNGNPRPEYFTILGTGYEVPNDIGKFLGTVKQHGFIWHLYFTHKK